MLSERKTLGRHYYTAKIPEVLAITAARSSKDHEVRALPRVGVDLAATFTRRGAVRAIATSAEIGDPHAAM